MTIPFSVTRIPPQDLLLRYNQVLCVYNHHMVPNILKTEYRVYETKEVNYEKLFRDKGKEDTGNKRDLQRQHKKLAYVFLRGTCMLVSPYYPESAL